MSHTLAYKTGTAYRPSKLHAQYSTPHSCPLHPATCSWGRSRGKCEELIQSASDSITHVSLFLFLLFYVGSWYSLPAVLIHMFYGLASMSPFPLMQTRTYTHICHHVQVWVLWGSHPCCSTEVRQVRTVQGGAWGSGHAHNASSSGGIPCNCSCYCYCHFSYHWYTLMLMHTGVDTHWCCYTLMLITDTDTDYWYWFIWPPNSPVSKLTGLLC